MEVFVALTPHIYLELCAASAAGGAGAAGAYPTFRLASKAFGPPVSFAYQYVPFKMTPQAAIKAALDSNAPLWTRSAQEATRRMQWRGYEPITLKYFDGAEDKLEIKLEIEDYELDAIGLGSWLYGMTQAKVFEKVDWSECRGCSATEVLFRSAGTKSDGKKYCAKCWNDFYKNSYGEKKDAG